LDSTSRRIKHVNEAPCAACTQILARYPGINNTIAFWFTNLQYQHPDVHCSCAGRGEQDQEDCFLKGSSRAHWLYSAHNYNAALDLFQLKNGVYSLNAAWFKEVIAPALIESLEWYGSPKAEYYELPHVQLRDWKKLRDSGLLVPVDSLVSR
jgi:hypothetical protein